MLQSIRVGGHAVIGSFALNGPEKCSGLEVHRYDGPMLAEELGGKFILLKNVSDIHFTPWGKQQSFQFSLFQRVEAVDDKLPETEPPLCRNRIF